VVQLEKEKGQALDAAMRARQALQDTEAARQELEQTNAATKGQLDAAIRRSNNMAYTVLAGLVIVLLVNGAVFLGKWRQARLRRGPSQKLLKPSLQSSAGATDEANLLSGNVLERELKEHVANINADPGKAPAMVPEEAPATAREETPATS
jgi:hypothetical protein